MAANFCLIPADATKFLDAIRNGQIDPEKLANMTSEERRTFFEGIVGESAKEVNALFESKLLLKNQQVGFASWAKKVSGITPEVRRDLFTKISKLDRVLNPAEEKAFLKDLASTRLGVDVTAQETKQIAQLSKAIDDAKTAMDQGGNRLDYGRAKVNLANYVNGLKQEAGKTSLKEIPGVIKNNPLGSIAQGVSNVAGVSKSLKASLDDSALFNQGWKTLFTHPGVWQKNARQSFVDMYKTFGGKKVMDEISAEIMSRPTYDKMIKAKLAIGNVEEAYPSQYPTKIPLLGKAFKASENAFEGFQYRTRADVFDKYLQIADKSGVNINDKAQLESIGKLVNSLTGRGYLGAGEKIANRVNNIFFSPRFLKSQVDFLTGHNLQKGVSPFVRKQAAINLVKVISGTAAVLGIARTLNPNSVELDPRSSNFGKIKIGNTTFTVSGGMAPVITLAARMLEGSTKSSTGTVTSLDSGKFGQPTRKDVVYNFFEGKLSPISSVVKDIAKGKDFSGNPITVGGELSNLLLPLPIANYNELKSNPNSANTMLAMISDALGITTNTIPAPYNAQGTSVKIKDNSLINQITVYAQAIGTDPETAFNRIFKGEQIKRVDNGTVIVQRMPLSASAAAKKAGGKNNPSYKLDHTVPLEIGGSNDSSNLKLVTTAQWKNYTPVENYLAKQLKSGNISKQNAQSTIQAFKQGRESKADVLAGKYNQR